MIFLFLSCKKRKENKQYYIQTSTQKEYLIRLEEYDSKTIVISNKTYSKLDVISKKGSTCIGDVHFFNTIPANGSIPESSLWILLNLNGEISQNKITGSFEETTVTTLSNQGITSKGTFTLDLNNPIK